MCLITRLTKPFVAKNDIVCYKYLYKKNDRYETPYQNVSVKLGEEMVANSNESYDGDYNNFKKYGINGGFIHATLGRKNTVDGNIVVKAIIPAGTEFYVGDDAVEVCARKLFITDETFETDNIPSSKDAIRELFTDYFADFFKTEESVSVGFYRLADGSYLNPIKLTSDINEDDIDGVVSDIHDGKVYVTSLDETNAVWCNNYSTSCKEQINSSDEARNDYNGEQHTKDILDRNDFENYPAFVWVKNHETKGIREWHMGAMGEVNAVGCTNQFIINIALALIDNSECITYGWLWSSSEYNSNHAWCLNPSNGTVGGNYKTYSGRVRAFAVFNT